MAIIRWRPVLLTALLLNGASIAVAQERTTLSGHAARVTSVAFAPDGKTLASGSMDETVKLWDVGTGRELSTLKGHTDPVKSVAFSPDGKTLASGSGDKTAKLWDVATARERATLDPDSSWVTAVAFAPDGKTLATGTGLSRLKLWDVATGRERATLREKVEDRGVPVTFSVESVAFAPDGQTLASSWWRTGKLWDVATGQARATLRSADREPRVASVAFSPDGTIVAFASSDKIVLWDVAAGRARATFEGDKLLVRSVAFSPEGKTLVSGGSYDNAVKLWDVGTGRELGSLRGHTEPVNSVAFSPDGKMLASGSEDKTVKLWDVSAMGKASVASLPPPPPQRPSAVSVGPPLWKRGYEWTFRWESPRGNGTFAWVVDREETVAGVEYYVVKSGTRREIYWRKTDLAYYMDKVGGVIETRHLPAESRYAWPMTPGKAWETRYTQENPRERRTTEAAKACRVAGEEDITVPAGTFRTLKVVCRSQRTGGITDEVWYSPQVMNWVRERSHFSYGIRERQLTAYKLN